jgi:hypothetical protein
LLNHVESRTASIAGRFPQRRDTLKCQMGFGWDFAPPLRTMGIWDDVYAVISENVFLRDVAVRQQALKGEAQLAIDVELDVGSGRSAQVRCTLVGETFESTPVISERPVDLTSGAGRYSLELSVPRPRLWWPWDHGHPDLYRLTVEVWDGDQCLDSLVQTIGLRQVELEGWTLRVNDRRVYARGANWVPADILPGRVVEADYLALLSLARQANMNLLRVWGGGLREKRAFYNLCDRLGILVWQEFPLACAFVTRFPHSPGYLSLVDRETRSIVRDLRNHPSIVLWCGGNEFNPERNGPLVDTLQQAVKEEDPARPFLPVPPKATATTGKCGTISTRLRPIATTTPCSPASLACRRLQMLLYFSALSQPANSGRPGRPGPTTAPGWRSCGAMRNPFCILLKAPRQKAQRNALRGSPDPRALRGSGNLDGAMRICPLSRHSFMLANAPRPTLCRLRSSTTAGAKPRGAVVC